MFLNKRLGKSSLRVKTPRNTNLMASMYIKGEKSSLPVDVRH